MQSYQYSLSGVPTGIRETILASGVWRPVEVPERPPVELLTWQEPWSSGRQDPETVLQLVQEDVDLGFAEWLPGGLAEARARFGTACAAGRLGLVKKEGSAPRLVGDSTVSGANLLGRLQSTQARESSSRGLWLLPFRDH